MIAREEVVDIDHLQERMAQCALKELIADLRGQPEVAKRWDEEHK
ncbi:hypothetical protein IIO_00146 [Bacillus cereus VD115]|nr:hypothetical protein IIO_00146 [Bacillus cereus VD115]